MKTKFIKEIHFFFKSAWIICAFLLFAHIVLIFLALCNISLPKIAQTDFVEYPTKLLLSPNYNHYFDRKNSKIIEIYPFNYKILEDNTSSELKVVGASTTLYIDVENEKILILMSFIKRILYLLFFFLISHSLSKIFGNFLERNTFFKKSSKQLKIIAYSFILFSPVLSIFNIIFQLSLMKYQMFGGSEMRVWDFNLPYIFYGIIVLTIKQMFQYGSMLQNEYDTTI